MFATGTLINTVSIIGGGLAGYFFKGLFSEQQQDSLNKTCGISNVIQLAHLGMTLF